MEHQIIATWAQVGVGIGQLIMIGWGLRQMGKASEDRNRQLDIMAASQSEQAQALREESRLRREESRVQLEALAQLLRRPA